MGLNPFKGNPLKGLSKPQLYVAIAGATGIGGYLVIRHHATTGSWNPWSSVTGGSNAANDPTAIDPVTQMAYSLDNVTDPITGQTYLQEAEQYGSVAAAESSVSGYGTGSPTGTGVPVGPGSGEPQPGSGNTGGAFTSDAAWAQAATAGLADIGYNETDVATSLGDYLESVPVTQDQAKIIRAALAEFGDPPVGKYSIILVPDKKPGAGQATVPDVVTLDLVDAQRDVTTAGLRSVARGPAFKTGHGTRVVTKQEPAARSKVTAGSTVTLTYEVKGTKAKAGK